MSEGGSNGSAPRPTFWRSVKLVVWSFAGIRSRKGYQEDLAKVNPLHVVLVALGTIFLMVLGLIGLVHWVVGK